VGAKEYKERFTREIEGEWIMGVRGSQMNKVMEKERSAVFGRFLCCSELVREVAMLHLQPCELKA
jgi:hypothetical protein